MPTTTDRAAHRRVRDVAVEAAAQAARLIRAHAGRLSRDAVRDKGLNDPVTEIDEAVQHLLVQTLTRAFPDADVLAEEGDDGVASDPVADGYRWIIDPIDGTANFVHGAPPYAVSIALQQGADLVVGVVLDAARDELFTAVRGGGAYRNGERLHVSPTGGLRSSLLTTGFPTRAFDHLDAYLDVLGRFMRAAQGVRRPGAASVDLAYVACGRYDGFFETGLNPWDVAAGALLVEEAGGRVTDYRDQPTPIFARQILATNGLIHPAMLDVLRPMQDIRS